MDAVRLRSVYATGQARSIVGGAAWRRRCGGRCSRRRDIEILSNVCRQMEPEYAATGRAERIEGGGMRFFYTVPEKRR